MAVMGGWVICWLRKVHEWKGTVCLTCGRERRVVRVRTVEELVMVGEQKGLTMGKGWDRVGGGSVNGVPLGTGGIALTDPFPASPRMRLKSAKITSAPISPQSLSRTPDPDLGMVPPGVGSSQGVRDPTSDTDDEGRQP
jgi:hypothetical protein